MLREKLVGEAGDLPSSPLKIQPKPDDEADAYGDDEFEPGRTVSVRKEPITSARITYPGFVR